MPYGEALRTPEPAARTQDRTAERDRSMGADVVVIDAHDVTQRPL
jgi:hypothetical protein